MRSRMRIENCMELCLMRNCWQMSLAMSRDKIVLLVLDEEEKVEVQQTVTMDETAEPQLILVRRDCRRTGATREKS